MEISKIIYGIDIASESFTVSNGVLYQDFQSNVSFTRTFKNNINGFKVLLSIQNHFKKNLKLLLRHNFGL